MRGFPWRTVLLSVIAAYLVLAVAAAAILYTGAYNVAATNAHWPITQRLLDLAAAIPSRPMRNESSRRRTSIARTGLR